MKLQLTLGKLGYGGTKTEMERLVKDAAKIDKSIDSNSLSYANVVKAIHAVQENMGIAGTTAKEAEQTISGSLASMKSAWGNLLPALIKGGDSFDQCVDNLVKSAGTFMNNIKPAITKALSGLGTLIENIAPIIEEQFPKLVDELLPPLLKAATSLVKGLIKALPSIIGTIVKELPDIFKSIGEAIGEAFGDIPLLKSVGKFFEKNADAITKFVPALLALVGGLMAFKKVKSITSVISGIFGKSSIGGVGGSGGASGGIFSSLAKANTKTILKGIANISLIVTSLGALLWLAKTVFADGINFSEMVQVIGLIGILGGVGAALTHFTGIVGKIAIATVLKGIANISLSLTSMGALLLLATNVFAGGVNFGEMIQVISLIGILGTVGTVLTVFAGIAGVIPITAVLTGLANIGLVLAGLTAVIVAYGALSKIPGFNDFITKGGEVLSNLFGVLGKIVGSVIGGIGEGISNSLPKIGKNLSDFAKSLEPMFNIVKGADMGGISQFFSSVGAFMLQMAGNNILSFFTGGTKLAGFGSELTTFISNASGFFTTVAALPQEGFDKAKALFQSLSDIGNVPKTGGITQWFSGETDFGSLATGLARLAGADVVGFYNTVTTLPQEGFEKAKALFQSLSDIGNIPKTGGIAQWFTGGTDFEALATGLAKLGSAGVVGFFTTVSTIPLEAFDRAKALFQTLSDIGNLPKSGGLAQFFTGSTDLSKLGSQLSQFGSAIQGFLTQVNSLNIENLNGLWSFLKGAGDLPADLGNVLSGCKTLMQTNLDEMKNMITTKGQEMVEALKTALNNMKMAIEGTDLLGSGAALINGLISGINSKKDAAVSAAAAIARAVNAEFDKIQKINSPSKVWFEKGAYLGEGQALGMESTVPQIKSTVEDISEISVPYSGSYSPESSYSNTKTANYETNSYAPVFNLTINGSTDSRAQARQVKRWINDAMNDLFESMSQKARV